MEECSNIKNNSNETKGRKVNLNAVVFGTMFGKGVCLHKQREMKKGILKL